MGLGGHRLEVVSDGALGVPAQDFAVTLVIRHWENMNMIATMMVVLDKIVRQVADANVKLLWKFSARKEFATVMDKSGGLRAFQSELSLAYMKGIARWICRPEKHMDIKLSTFVYKSLRWEVKHIYNRMNLISIPDECDSNKSYRDKAKNVIHLHGSEGRRSDSCFLEEQTSDVVIRKEFQGIAATSIKMAKRFLNHKQLVSLQCIEHNRTLADVGKELKLSKERVRQHRIRAEKRVRDSISRLDLEGI